MGLLQNFYHGEMDSFPIIRDISDEIRGDINKCDFLALYDEMSTFKRFA